MAALVVAHVRPRKPELMPEYAQQASKTLEAYGGEVLHRGGFHSVLLGESTPHGLGVMRFPDAQAATDWFNSSEYRAVAPLRDEAADMTFVLYELAG